ncbi:hypothetical protein VC83_05222 [Pseudogymnoascus destructans]|uniref:BZIP domain-containing protein n=2 Tax=Pseudogymnoascus destructans TaxID=655981 RepID=L8G0C8_PSED2|nr:uncharacterized protein VC83_05222 [Pseudogymnoascus destructans]ELR06715.1 hypothetical protein GMDG_00332 [Pseudogymnoascus destructans 20631-21]OAF57900.1 hypothetical protein VC83_05222 [Pseudogymnoascus destructans]
MDEKMSIDKKEDMREASVDSMESTPEADAGPPNQEHTEQPKRKGGRKPIYATSEERKQRNRQAQAAFRERRTEYIKQLEETIRVHETNLHSLQTAHRSAADECLMLRYKNSLLERILLEKGIDVQSELRAKTGSPSLGPSHMPQGMAMPPTVQRAIMNRHHQARRSNSNIAPKLEPVVPLGNPSPQSRPTPSSHHSSPTSTSPGFAQANVLTPPAPEAQIQQQRAQPLKPHLNHGLGVSVGPQNSGLGPALKGIQAAAGAGVSADAPAAYYPSFQNHIEQLEQEYDAQTDIVSDQDQPESAGPGPYPTPFALPPMMNPQQQQQQQRQQPRTTQAGEHVPGFNSMTQQLLDPYDPMLDMDPFGLSASMHFPTQFTFDTSSMR